MFLSESKFLCCKIVRMNIIVLGQLCPTHGPRATCDPVEGFVRPNLGFICSESILHTLTSSPYFDNLEFNIFDAGSSQCHFATSVTIALGFERFQYIRLS